MRWPWRRRARTEPDPDAVEALRSAEEAKASAEAQWPAVRRAANGVRRHSQQNHFAELFIEAMRRRES